MTAEGGSPSASRPSAAHADPPTTNVLDIHAGRTTFKSTTDSRKWT